MVGTHTTEIFMFTEAKPVSNILPVLQSVSRSGSISLASPSRSMGQNFILPSRKPKCRLGLTLSYLTIVQE